MTDLAERVERLTEPSREIDAEIVQTLCPGAWVGIYVVGDSEPTVFHAGAIGIPDKSILRAYTSSIDAAMTLVPEGWNWMTGCRNQPLARAFIENGKPAFLGFSSRPNPDRRWHEVVAATPAIALTAAALRARKDG